jgi:hypothetical protein
VQIYKVLVAPADIASVAKRVNSAGVELGILISRTISDRTDSQRERQGLDLGIPNLLIEFDKFKHTRERFVQMILAS